MGADENSSTKSKAVEPSFSERVEEKLKDGWQLREGGDGQLLLVPPPSYGEPRQP